MRYCPNAFGKLRSIIDVNAVVEGKKEVMNLEEGQTRRGDSV